MESIFYKKQKLNVEAPEFIPTHVIEKINENQLFDRLEKKFVEEHKWIFEYDPLADVVVNEQMQRKRRFEEIDTEENESSEVEEQDTETNETNESSDVEEQDTENDEENESEEKNESEQTDTDMEIDLQGSDVESVCSVTLSMMSIDSEFSVQEYSPTWADIVKGTSPRTPTPPQTI